MQKPSPNEYASHYQPYIDLVGEGEFLELITLNKQKIITFFENIAEEKHDYRYAENKWTIKQILFHINDTERVFAYRTLACSRCDKNPLPFMDENQYAMHADVSNRSLKSLIREFEIVRENSLLLFENITEEQSKFAGTIGGEYPITARALGYLMIGHALHHVNVIKERYL
jgi:uncharacterized damage-inducible protein DinB